MLLQGAGKPGGTLPPPGFAPPIWEELVKQWEKIEPPQETVTLGPATVILGHDDDEALDDALGDKNAVEDHEFGWDNEHPRREVEVKPFRIEWRPVSNGEFYKFWSGEGKDMVKFPASWIMEGNRVMVGASPECTTTGAHVRLIGPHFVWSGGHGGRERLARHDVL